MTKLLRVREAAEFLGIAPGTLYHWAAANIVPCYRLGQRCLLFDLESLIQWVSKYYQPPVSEEEILRKVSDGNRVKSRQKKSK